VAAVRPARKEPGRLFILLVIALAMALPRVAEAQNKAAADAAFREGKRLLADGDTAAACARFEGSLKLMDQLGVRLNLADCYERLGKLSAAYGEFRAAEVAARRAGDRRVAFARDRIAALAKRMPHLIVTLLRGADLPGLKIARDGDPVDGGLVDTPLPIDPGEHTVTVSAPGRRSWSKTFEAREGAHHTIEVPVLEPEAGESTESEAGEEAPPGRAGDPAGDLVDEEPSPGRTRRIVGIGIGVVGLASLGTGVAFGALARGKWSDAQEGGHCAADGRCDDVGYPLAQDARQAATTATVLIGAGLAAVAAGIVVYVTAPSGGDDAGADESDERARLAPVLGADQFGVALTGRF
jgi:hypothetical protein